jgi:predicted nucleic acid-binding protein
MPNSWICVDANLVIRLVADPSDEAVRQLWAGWDAAHRQLAAPGLIYYEVANALYRYQQLGYMTASSVGSALDAALALPLRPCHDVDLHRRAVALAQRFALPAAHDAHYLAVAERLDGELWTANRALAHAVQSELPWVHLASKPDPD